MARTLATSAFLTLAGFVLSGCSAEAQKVIKDCDSCPDLVNVPPGDMWVAPLKVAEVPPGEELPKKDFRGITVNGFLIGRTEVTRGQWRALMGPPPKTHAGYGDDYPVTNVSWKDAQEYIRRLNRKTGNSYRLPTEAEWIYAARAGTADGHHFAYDTRQISALAWHTGNREFSRVIDCTSAFQCGMFNAPRLSEVAQRHPNAFGLYDMYGNAEEWVDDVYHRYFIKWPDEPQDLADSGDPAVRILRGGSVLQDPLVLITQRSGYQKDTRSAFGGFRVARSLPFTPPIASAQGSASDRP